MLELVLTRKDNAGLNTQSVHIAYDSANHLLALIGDILDISRIESGKLSLSPEPTRIKELLETTSNVFSGLARQKRLYLRLDISPLATELVWVDALKVKQIISNLLSNAIKFTEQGGIDIRCHVTPASKTSLHVLISVSDTGAGIPAAQIDQIFKPFFITRDAISDPNAGAGLGLAICKELSDFMGGRLEVASDTKLGTQMTFSIVLDCVRAESHILTPAPGGTVSLNQDVKLTVLIAEDHLPSQYLLYQQLSYLGHRVVTASNGLEGYTFIFRFWTKTAKIFLPARIPSRTPHCVTRSAVCSRPYRRRWRSFALTSTPTVVSAHSSTCRTRRAGAWTTVRSRSAYRPVLPMPCVSNTGLPVPMPTRTC